MDAGDNPSCELATVTGSSSEATQVAHSLNIVQPTRKSSRLISSRIPKPMNDSEEGGEDFLSGIAAVTGSSSDEDSVAPPLATTQSKIIIAPHSASTHIRKKPLAV
jgi:hypothetical protein